VLDWHEHRGTQNLIRDLNWIYRTEPALYEVDFEPHGFRWLDANDVARNAYSFLRLSADGSRAVACVCNLSPVPRERYRVGLPHGGNWVELLNTDSVYYAGSGLGNLGQVTAEEHGAGGQPFSAALTLPPLSVLWLRPA